MTVPAVVALLGLGAVGLHALLRLPPEVAAVVVDVDVVAPENLATSPYAPRDLGRLKARVAAERHRSRGGLAWAICGDVRYGFRPGLARRLAAIIVALDNPPGIHDAAEVVWDAGIEEVPVFVATCGNAGTGGGHLVRVFRPGRSRVCPVCFYGEAERAAERQALGASCAATTAPRASAEAADGAAASVVALLERWLAGDHTIAGTRVQTDGAASWVAKMPPRPTPGCPVPHHPLQGLVLDLPGDVGTTVVGDVVARALRHAGDDAVLSLGRRGVPVTGSPCSRCGDSASTPLRLAPAALCGCGELLDSRAMRSTVGVRDLVAAGIEGLSLDAFGCAPGDELVAVGSGGVVRMRAAFDWTELG